MNWQNPYYGEYTRGRRRLCCAILTLVVLPYAVLPALGQNSDLVTTWLLASCLDGDEGHLAAALTQAGVSIQPSLIQAYRSGPPAQDLSELRLTAGMRFDDLHAWVSTNGTAIGLTGDDIRGIQGQTRDQFVAQEVQNAVLSYQSRALVGLGLVAGVAGIQTLQSVANDHNSPLQDVASHALQRVADVNIDGQVNCLDLAIVKAAFGKKSGQEGFDARADTNKDGIVNILDLAVVARQLPPGTTCP